ncbi:hypothetical protein CORC01_06220 [Colletotrichum orchidophilum]|uniref:Uncharacterized protein n=1 Tax=Colletotrichum orchidophilum TaxID=1209926 RepID=A0A1G4BAI5_9PEZI|nr:uncharacterized protein CORC01_06220 [Colletotrichum orchidophilum]OHE98429.1 hypothetical protein CORC01_06220 [Colletotrichum orchidophilum]
MMAILDQDSSDGKVPRTARLLGKGFRTIKWQIHRYLSDSGIGQQRCLARLVSSM